MYGWSMNDGEKKNMIHQYLIIIYIWSAFHKLLVILPSNHFPSMRNAHGLYKHKMVHYGHLRVETLLQKKNPLRETLIHLKIKQLVVDKVYLL